MTSLSSVPEDPMNAYPRTCRNGHEIVNLNGEHLGKHRQWGVCRRESQRRADAKYTSDVWNRLHRTQYMRYWRVGQETGQTVAEVMAEDDAWFTKRRATVKDIFAEHVRRGQAPLPLPKD
jgi:hypothetical protein